MSEYEFEMTMNLSDEDYYEVIKRNKLNKTINTRERYAYLSPSSDAYASSDDSI